MVLEGEVAPVTYFFSELVHSIVMAVGNNWIKQVNWTETKNTTLSYGWVGPFMFCCCCCSLILTLFTAYSKLTIGENISVTYACPKTTQLIVRNRMPCRQWSVLSEWSVFRSRLPFVYHEKTTRLSLRLPA